RFSRDWSSDVCSSDLARQTQDIAAGEHMRLAIGVLRENGDGQVIAYRSRSRIRKGYAGQDLDALRAGKALLVVVEGRGRRIGEVAVGASVLVPVDRVVERADELLRARTVIEIGRLGLGNGGYGLGENSQAGGCKQLDRPHGAS